MNFLAFTAICLILAHYKTYIFLMLIFDSFISIIALINRIFLLITDVSFLAVFFIFLLRVNKSLTLSFLKLYMHLVCKFLGFNK